MIPHMRYPGGKGKTYQRLINLMPPHEVYIETHLGGGAVLRHKRPALQSIGLDCDPQVIERWADQTPPHALVMLGRAEEFLSSYAFTGTELVYCAPPYLPSTRRRERVYTYDYSLEDHEKLLSLLRGLPCKVILSGYASTLYDTALHDWSRISFQAMSHIGLREEVAWFNFQPPTQLHDSRHIGATFRQRQSASRRLSRMKRKLEKMDPVERNALHEWLNSTYIGSEGLSCKLL